MKPVIVLFAALLLAEVAQAQNITFMRRGPMAFLDAADEQLLRETVGKALNDSKDGDSLEWKNPDTGHFGAIEVLDTHEDYGTTCRSLRAYAEAEGRKGGGIYRLCLADDGTWRFAPNRQPES